MIILLQQVIPPGGQNSGAGNGLRPGELYSFFLVASAIIAAAVFFLTVFWIFVLFALIDGLGTQFRIGFALSVNRVAFVFVVLLLSSASFGVLSIIVEILVLLVTVDLSFLLRELRQYRRQDLYNILSYRLRSYIYTVVPAGVFSAGVLYVASAPFSNGVSPSFAISLLGISSVAAFLVVLFVIRTFRPEGSSGFK